MSDTRLPTQTESAELEEIVFGHRCYWCARREPCDCHDLPHDLTSLTQEQYDAKCKCSCGRCTFEVGR